MGAPLSTRYILYSYMEPLGKEGFYVLAPWIFTPAEQLEVPLDVLGKSRKQGTNLEVFGILGRGQTLNFVHQLLRSQGVLKDTAAILERWEPR